MVKYYLSLILLIGSYGIPQAQTADEILANYFENIGGIDTWKQLKSFKKNAKMSMQGMEFPGVIYGAQPNKQRVEISVQGKSAIQAYDGQTAWWVNPFMGGANPQIMPEDMADDMKKERFEDDLIDYREKGHSVSFEGKEEVEGTSTYKLKLSKSNGEVTYYYFDAEYFIPIMNQSVIESGPQKGQMVDTYFSDYQEVNGLYFPFFLEVKINGQTMQSIAIEKIELNVDLTEDFFSFPK